MTKIVMGFLIGVNLLIGANAFSEVKGGEVGNPVLANFKGSPNDFYYGKDLLKACDVNQTKRYDSKSDCIKYFEGMYISKQVNEQIIKECFGEVGESGYHGSAVECAKMYDGKFYPKEAKKACKGLLMEACTAMFKDNIVQYPLAPSRELLDEVQQNINNGNYARVKVLMDVLLSKEEYITSEDKCGRSTASVKKSIEKNKKKSRK